MAKLSSLKNTPVDGRPQLVDLGMPVFTDTPRPWRRRTAWALRLSPLNPSCAVAWYAAEAGCGQ